MKIRIKEQLVEPVLKKLVVQVDSKSKKIKGEVIEWTERVVAVEVAWGKNTIRGGWSTEGDTIETVLSEQDLADLARIEAKLLAGAVARIPSEDADIVPDP